MTTTNENYQVQCDPNTGLCTAKLKVARGRAYSIGEERRAPWVSDRIKAAGHDSEYLGYGFQVDTREIDRENRTVPFVASTATIDRYGDIIEQEGWMLDFYKRNPVGLLNHDSRSLPIAKAIKCGIVNGVLFALMQFAKVDEYPVADTTFKLIQGGYLNAMSVGFIPLEFKYRYEEVPEGEDPKPWPVGRIYTKSELLENSVVTVPANPEALVQGRSFDFSSVKSVTLGPVFEAAFKAIEPETDASFGVLNSLVKFEASEGSYFTFDGQETRRFGSVNPFDTKDVDADPYLIVAQKESASFRAGSVESAKKQALTDARALIRANSDPEFFLCELTGADNSGIPVYRSMFLISAKENARLAENKTKMPCTCNDNKGAVLGANAATAEKSVVPFHAFPLAAPDATWDAGKEMGSTDKPADWKKMSTIVLGDGSKKGDFKLPHHKGPGGKFATVKRGVANALARANQVKGASSSDKAGAKKHLLKHMSEFKKKDGKAYDIEPLDATLAKLEAFRDAATEDRRSAITAAIRAFIIDPDSVESKEFLVDAEAKAFDKFERGFTNQKMNKRLTRAHKSVVSAINELEECQKDMMPELCSVRDLMSSVMTGSNADPDEDDSDYIGDSVSSKLEEAHATSKEVHRGVAQSRERFKTFMQAAIGHLDALCDYVTPDEGETTEEKDDDPTYTQEPNAEADGQETPDDKMFSEATKLLVEASKGSEAQGTVPGSNAVPPARAESESEKEFEQLLGLVSEGIR